jgi:putative endopeptidase
MGVSTEMPVLAVFAMTTVIAWCIAERPDFSRESLRDDGHAPGRYRTNAPLSNMPAFARAFACPNTAPMVRTVSTRCSFWGLAFP